MSKVKRKLKNIVRNIMLSETFANTNLVKNMRKNHKEKLEEGRRVLFKEHAKDCLETIKENLDKNNLHFWLDYGTLLGAMREKDFIAHDLDIDLGMFYENQVEEVEKAFKEANIKKVREFTLDGKVVEQTYSYKGLYFDIFYYFKDENLMWTYGFTFKNNKLNKVSYKDKDVSTGFEGMKYFVRKRGLEKIMFKGKEYTVPENPDGYLRENYGPNYMTPIKEWDYVEAPTNQEKLKGGDIVMIEYYN
ncbi:LicD family protein [Clostridium perfringens]|uniref:LicD family protein n=1 Tax=Clostridium perfringens TaxID=1502 RepID=UPI0013E2FB7E|nr:LicD family protein [Clostridium perfringens]NGT57327.1 LicD family protein [Clostridium perfringens]